MPKDVLTANEAAELLSVGVQTILRKARARQLPAAKVGRQWRFSRSQLLNWIKAGGDAPRPPETDDDELEDFQRLTGAAASEIWDDEEDAIYENWREIYGVEEG